MCTYCMIGDWQFRRNPPFWPETPDPLIPMPSYPPPNWQPWGLEEVKEFKDLLERVKKLEDALGCPCEPNKADYIGILKQRIEELEKRQEAAKREGA
jgi:hypothetical protein